MRDVVSTLIQCQFAVWDVSLLISDGLLVVCDSVWSSVI